MYADNSTIVADFLQELQSMFNIASAYSSRWRYQLNASKSFVVVIGETHRPKHDLFRVAFRDPSGPGD